MKLLLILLAFTMGGCYVRVPQEEIDWRQNATEEINELKETQQEIIDWIEKEKAEEVPTTGI